MEYLVLAPPGVARDLSGQRLQVSRLDHPFDHPDDPTEPVSTGLDRRGTQREQPRSVWSRPVRRRAPGYGSGGWGFEFLAARIQAGRRLALPAYECSMPLLAAFAGGSVRWLAAAHR